MNFKKKKILVTGGRGFIGNHLSARLVSLGAIVNLYDLADGNDITDEAKLKSHVKKKYDIIFHFAGYSGSARSNEEKLKSFRINSLATANLAELIVNFSPKTKLILSSSRLEYGVPKYLPVDENHPTLPQSMYGLSKLTATQIVLVYHQQHNLDVTILRTSNVYGPHKMNNFYGYNVINLFIDLAKKNLTLNIFGDGNQKRDYLYVDDFVSTCLLCVSKKSSGQIYNLGYGKGIKLKDMADLIIKKVGCGKLKFTNWPKDYQEVETGSYITDISKIKKELGFYPNVDFEQGIEKSL